MNRQVWIDLCHPDFVNVVPAAMRASSKPGAGYISAPDWVRSLPAEIAHEEPEDRVAYRLRPGEHGEEEALHGDGGKGSMRFAYGLNAMGELDRARNYPAIISLHKGSAAVLREEIPSEPPAPPGPYVEKDPDLLELTTRWEPIYQRAVHLAHRDDVFWQESAIYAANSDLGRDPRVPGVRL